MLVGVMFTKPGRTWLTIYFDQTTPEYVLITACFRHCYLHYLATLTDARWGLAMTLKLRKVLSHDTGSVASFTICLIVLFFLLAVKLG
jgi:hypothetical protein